MWLIDFMTPVTGLFFGTAFILLSKSSKNYQKIIDNHGEQFAKTANKYMKICGYLSIICSALWILLIIAVD